MALSGNKDALPSSLFLVFRLGGTLPLPRDFSPIGSEVEVQHLVDSDPPFLHLLATDTHNDEPEWKVDLGQTVTTCDAVAGSSPHAESRLM